MKTVLQIILLSLIISAVYAGDFQEKGVISGWKFAPIQVDIGLVENKKLVDESSDTMFSLGVWILRQKSSVISFSFVANTLQNNYGIQLSPLLGVVTDNNYGVSIGWDNFSKNCYGIQLGLLNHSWAGEQVEKVRERWQFCGANIADTVYIGLVNISNKIQIGLLNMSPGAVFQIGLLNHNIRSYIPWLPLVNWDMGRKEK